MSEASRLPPGVSRRQFLEDVLDVMGDADAVYENDADGRPALVISRADLVAALAEELGQ